MLFCRLLYPNLYASSISENHAAICDASSTVDEECGSRSITITSQSTGGTDHLSKSTDTYVTLATLHFTIMRHLSNLDSVRVKVERIIRKEDDRCQAYLSHILFQFLYL